MSVIMKMTFKFFKNKSLLILASLLLLSTFIGCKSDQLKYRSEAVISTGIVDSRKSMETEKEPAFLGRFQDEMNFTNLIGFMKSRKVMSLLTYRLLINEMKGMDKSSDEVPFRYPKESMKGFTSHYTIETWLNYMESKLSKYSDTTKIINNDESLQRIAANIGFDYKSLLDSMTFHKIEQTNNIKVTFVSNNPKLSHFALTNYISDFFKYYDYLQMKNEKDEVEFYNSILEKRKEELNNKKQALAKYRLDNNLIQIGNQPTMIIEISKLVAAQEEASKKVATYQKVIVELNDSMENNQQKEYQSTAKEILTSERILSLKTELQALMQLQAASQDPASYNQRVLTKQKQMDQEIKKYATRQSQERKTRQEDLLQQRKKAKAELLIAEKELAAYEDELSRLHSKVNLTTGETYLTDLNKEISLLGKEYFKIKELVDTAQFKLRNREILLKLVQKPTIPN